MRDEKNYLAGVHPQLASVITEASRKFEHFTGYQIRITSGYRSKEEQHALFVAGKSKTTHSAHMDGRAVDVAILNGKNAIWKLEWYAILNQFVQKEAREFDVIIGWGGHWKIRDGVHFWIAEDGWQVSSVLQLEDLSNQKTA